MSTEIKKEVNCPACGAKAEARMWSGVNAEVNPNLRLRVLDESFFDWRCPQCGAQAVLAYPCLYHDKGRRFMIYILPGNPDPEKAAGVAAQFPQLRGVRKRVTGSLTSTKEKVLLFEDGLDDRAAELVKLLLATVLTRALGKTVGPGFYCSSDEAKDRIGFSFFVEGEEEPVRKMTTFSAYRAAQSIVSQLLPPDGEDFLLVDESFAKRLLARYRGEEPEPETAEKAQESAAEQPAEEPASEQPAAENSAAQDSAAEEAPAAEPDESTQPPEDTPAPGETAQEGEL